MPQNEILAELKKELIYLYDLWKNAGVATSGDIMNKIKETERKIADLENMDIKMPLPNNDEKAYDIGSLVQQNKISEALDSILQDSQKKDIHNTCILLKSQYNNIEHQRNMNLITFDEYQRERNRIINAILNLQ